MTTPLTAERIAELREIAEKAHWGGCVCVFCHTWRRTFDMATVKQLLDEIQLLRAANISKLLREVKERLTPEEAKEFQALLMSATKGWVDEVTRG